MKKVFITGATGFIGYHLLRELHQKGVEVWVLCRKNSGNYSELQKVSGVHIVEAGLEEMLLVPQICKERNFDAFYHLAWKGASGNLRTDYTTQIENIKWTCDCVKIAKFLKCKKIIVTGTVCEKQCEAIGRQQNFYGSSYYLFAKKTANDLARSLSKKIDIPLIWCQFYHPIGIFNKKEQLIANTIYKILNHENVEFGKATNLFDIIDVRDLVIALRIMGERNLIQDEYYIGSGTPQLLKEYLDIVKNLIDSSAYMDYGAINTIDLPMRLEWLDMLPFQKEVNFTPKISLKKSIIDMKMWMENEDKYNYEKWHF